MGGTFSSDENPEGLRSDIASGIPELSPTDLALLQQSVAEMGPADLEHFKAYVGFPDDAAADLLFQKLGKGEKNITVPILLQTILYFKISAQMCLQLFFDIFDADSDGCLQVSELRRLFLCAYQMLREMEGSAPTSSGSSEGIEFQGIDYLLSSLTGSEAEGCVLNTIEWIIFRGWVLQNMPMLPELIKVYINRALFNPISQLEMGHSPSPSPLSLIRLQSPCTLISPATAFALSLSSLSLPHSWSKLYDSMEDGLSFSSFLDRVCLYKGPTMLLVADTNGSVFGAFTSQGWEERQNFYGNEQCKLFSLRPKFRLYNALSTAYQLEDASRDGTPHAAPAAPAAPAALPAASASSSSSSSSSSAAPGHPTLHHQPSFVRVEPERNYMYLHHKDQLAASKEKKKPKGIALGGDVERGFRVYIDHDLNNGYTRDSCQSYTAGPLTTTSGNFRVAAIQVWGGGGRATLDEFKTFKARDEKIKERMRMVNKRALADSDFDKEFLFGKTFGHRENISEDR